MAKATKTGNIAATGIQQTTTKEPTVSSTGTTASQAEKAAKASSTATAKATSTVKSTGGSNGTGCVSAGGIGTAPTVTLTRNRLSRTIWATMGAAALSGNSSRWKPQYVNTFFQKLMKNKNTNNYSTLYHTIIPKSKTAKK